MLLDAGVQLLFLPPYSPDFNPIEESFHDLKAHIRANNAYITLYRADFGQFLHVCMEKLGSGINVEAHFKNSQIDVSELPGSSASVELEHILV
jgi:hypothetical protein